MMELSEFFRWLEAVAGTAMPKTQLPMRNLSLQSFCVERWTGGSGP